MKAGSKPFVRVAGTVAPWTDRAKLEPLL